MAVRNTVSGEYAKPGLAETDPKGSVTERPQPDKVKAFIKNLVGALTNEQAESLRSDVFNAEKRFPHKNALLNALSQKLKN